MDYIIPHYINGKTLVSDNLPSRDIVNPAEGKIIGKVHFADSTICQEAITAAHKAAPAWANTPALKRAQILFKFRELLEKYQSDLAHLVTKEHGKSLDDAKGSIARGIELVEFHCNIATQLQGQFSANVANRVDCQTLRQPLGICAGVSPFNFPVMVPLWMTIPAIACGNTFILKPSEQDPSAPIRLFELLSDAGLPPGVANCIQGDKHAVDFLLTHPDIAAFTAVASTPVAKYIYETAITHGKRAHTFGGAKNHCLVMPDADITQTASAIVSAAFGSAGERCMALSVVVTVGNETADALVKALLPQMKAMRIDEGTAQHCDMGPLISQAHRERVSHFIEQGIKEGARLLVDGRSFQHPTHSKGFFMGPSLFDNVSPEMEIYQNEIFGPVLVLLRVNDFEEALALINRHQYGNGSAIFTRDGYFAREYAFRVQAGMVGVNIPIPVPVASHPFGGWKQSSFGDTNMHGQESIHFYTRLKTITSKWPENEQNEHGFAMPNHR